MFRFRFGLILYLGFLLIGCAQREEQPQLIASYPTGKPITAPSGTLPDMPVVYNAIVEMEVSNVDKAVEKITGLAYEYNGALVSSQSWYRETGIDVTLVLAVPAVHFDAVHRALLRLGDLISERVSGELSSSGYVDEWQVFSMITVHLHAKDRVGVQINLPDWRPLQTFSKAWLVLASVLGFLVDILIWVGVVAGPFVLLGWVLRRLIRRNKRNLDVQD